MAAAKLEPPSLGVRELLASKGIRPTDVRTGQFHHDGEAASYCRLPQQHTIRIELGLSIARNKMWLNNGRVMGAVLGCVAGCSGNPQGSPVQ